MNESLSNSEGNGNSACAAWLARPLSTWWCVVGWISASSLFVGLTALVGGPTADDSSTSTFPAWAIAHGYFSCSYPPSNSYHFPITAPLYPLLSGGLAALLRIGHSVGFPKVVALGPHCNTAFDAIARWSILSHADSPTRALGYLSWLVLLAGTVALLRASDRGGCGWEPTVLAFLALTPPVYMAIGVFFHPQDVLALGLVLGGVAGARRGHWGWAGVLLGLAFCSQQFAILALLPLAVVAPRERRFRYLLSVTIAVVAVDGPFVLMTSGRAFTAAVIGTGWVHSSGGTILSEVGLSKPSVLFLSRILPVIGSVALAYWARRRLGSRVVEAIPLISLIATSFSFRLLFEVNLWGYYFIATAVTLLILDAALGRIRGVMVAWLVIVTWAFNPVLWTASTTGHPLRVALYCALPIMFIGVALLLLVLDALHHRIRWYVVAVLLLVLIARAHEGWRTVPTHHPTSVWYWQLILVPIAVVWAARPLIAMAREHSDLGVTPPSLMEQ